MGRVLEQSPKKKPKLDETDVRDKTNYGTDANNKGPEKHTTSRNDKVSKSNKVISKPAASEEDNKPAENEDSKPVESENSKLISKVVSKPSTSKVISKPSTSKEVNKSVLRDDDSSASKTETESTKKKKANKIIRKKNVGISNLSDFEGIDLAESSAKYVDEDEILNAAYPVKDRDPLLKRNRIRERDPLLSAYQIRPVNPLSASMDALATNPDDRAKLEEEAKYTPSDSYLLEQYNLLQM